MGKTLQRQKKKAGAQHAAQHLGSTAQPGAVTKKKKGGNKEGELVTLISEAFNKNDWEGAFRGLEELRRQGIVPKLGSVQRWTRMADLVGDERQAAKLLAAIIRTIPGSGGPMAAPPSGREHDAVRKHPPFQPPLSPQQRAWLAAGKQQQQQPQPTTQQQQQQQQAVVGEEVGAVTEAVGELQQSGTGPEGGCSTSYSYEGAFTQVPQDPSTLPAKRPPNWQELQIWVAQPGTIRFGPDPQVVRVEVPFVQGAFVLTGLLSPSECRQLVAASESLGYRWDVDYSFNPSAPGSAAALAPTPALAPSAAAKRPPMPSAAAGMPAVTLQQQHPLLSAARAVAGGDRAAGCVWLADESLLGPIFRRAAPHLPQALCGGSLAGINARLRFYRYDQNNVYRPHVDGAWPGSGLKDGQLVHDAFGDRWSRLTFLVYLNDDFDGGSTTFFTPAPDDPSALDARGVKPCAGNVLVFPHGDTTGSLVHEGSTVTAGSKYVIRTDVLYKAAGPPGYNSSSTTAGSTKVNNSKTGSTRGGGTAGRQ